MTKMKYSLHTRLECKLLKQMSSRRRLFLWNRCAHTPSSISQVSKCCSDYLAWGYIFPLQLNNYTTIHIWDEIHVQVALPPSLVRMVTYNDNIISMFPPLLVHSFKNQITLSVREQEVFWDLACWLQNNLGNGRIVLED